MQCAPCPLFSSEAGDTEASGVGGRERGIIRCFSRKERRCFPGMMFPELAVLIAGGRSRRMGRDKCVLEWQGKPLWEHQLGTLSSVGAGRVAVVSPGRPEWLSGDTSWIPDVPGDCGPLGGILAALESVKSGLVLVLAVDLPAMTGECLRDLLHSCTRERGCVPVADRGYEPVAAVYPAAAAVMAREWLDSGRRDLQGWVGELIKRDLVRGRKVEAPGFFRNLNCPEDLEGGA